MKWNNITSRDLQRLVSKLSLERTGHNSRENRYWYILDGKKLFKLTFPNVHGGGKTVTIGFVAKIIESLRVNKEEWVDLISCPMTAEEYEGRIRELMEQGKL